MIWFRTIEMLTLLWPDLALGNPLFFPWEDRHWPMGGSQACLRPWFATKTWMTTGWQSHSLLIYDFPIDNVCFLCFLFAVGRVFFAAEWNKFGAEVPIVFLDQTRSAGNLKWACWLPHFELWKGSTCRVFFGSPCWFMSCSSRLSGCHKYTC